MCPPKHAFTKPNPKTRRKPTKPYVQRLLFASQKKLKKYLNSDQLKLYTLIWKRTIACQMIEATLHTVAVDLNDQGDSKMLPPLEERQTVDVSEIKGEQHFTEPPPRYTERAW
ncbi:unnamed protein product [Ixodes hexagonus]